MPCHLSPKLRRVSASISQVVDLHRQLAPLGLHDLAGGADPVAEADVAEAVEVVGAPRPSANSWISPPLPSRSVAKAELALGAVQHHAGRRRVTVDAGLLAVGEAVVARRASSAARGASTSNRYGARVTSVTRGVLLEDEAQAVQGEPRLDVVDRARQRAR